MSSKVGTFFFEDGVPYSHARLIRDSVLGQILSPEPGMPKLKTEQDCKKFVRDHCPAVFSDAKFSVRLAD